MVKVDHFATEQHIRASGLSWNFLEDSQYAEAVGVAMAKFAIVTGLYETSEGEGKVGFVSRDDCVDCAVALLLGAGEPNTTYTPTGPESLSQRDAMDLAAEISGRPIETRIVSTEVMQATFDAMGVPRTVADLTPESPIPWVSEDMLSFCQALKEGVFDIVTDDVRRLTGHAPKSLREVLIATRAEWDPA
jgi:NAD(P)H dehydrogenase (quinone)